MKLQRPKSTSVYVQARDFRGRSSKSVTLYDTTPNEVIEAIRKAVESRRRLTNKQDSRVGVQ